jgi:hypothetical protein
LRKFLQTGRSPNTVGRSAATTFLTAFMIIKKHHISSNFMSEANRIRGFKAFRKVK